ncbi:MAG: DNA repair protein RecN [Clostridiales bacterium]|nr:DNA repair protein RecN [Clostridiales bacterium]
MLSHLTIRNVAIIDEVVIHFGEGLNILSGETGAGKSIIIDSMNLVLGERADRELIRAGADSARVEALFELSEDSPAREMLRNLSLEDDVVILSRELSSSGRNVCRINGSLATVGQLREMSARLVDIHGQHEHQSLLNEANHVHILDAFGGEPLRALIDRTDALYEEYRCLNEQLSRMRSEERTRLQRIDMLSFQIHEIESADLQPGEEEELRSRLRIAANLEKITSALTETYRLLYGGSESTAAGLVSDAARQMDAISDVDTVFQTLRDRLDTLDIELGDIVGEVRDMQGRYEYDPDELNALEERLETIRVLEKKYGLTVEAVLSHLEETKARREELLTGERTMNEIEARIGEIQKEWAAAAGELTRTRREMASEIERTIERQLADLGMGGAVFRIALEPGQGSLPRRGGAETVAFRIATNPGEPLRSLSKTASGGELSRIMLAIKNGLADSDSIPTLIFDEIDTGVSGRMARVIAEKLNSIARSRQVICVTHTAQIAAMADHHFRIEKRMRDGRNITAVEALDDEARILEISRLVGGEEISSMSLEHAREMVRWCSRFKHGAASGGPDS